MTKQMQKTSMQQKSSGGWKLWLGLAIGAAVVGASWLIWTQVQEPEIVEVEKIVEKEVVVEVPVPTEEDDSEEPTTSTDGWITQEWGNYSFMYPPSWTLEPNYYQTPAQEAEGEPLELIGYYLIYQGDLGDNKYIQLGGRQADCVVFQGAPRCTDDPFHVNTTSSNPEVLRVYDIFIDTITSN